jgi:hypothetical protein
MAEVLKWLPSNHEALSSSSSTAKKKKKNCTTFLFYNEG